MMERIRILEKLLDANDMPFVFQAVRKDEDDGTIRRAWRKGDVVITITNLEGQFRLTPMQQERLGNFLLGKK